LKEAFTSACGGGEGSSQQVRKECQPIGIIGLLKDQIVGMQEAEGGGRKTDVECSRLPSSVSRLRARGGAGVRCGSGGC
jgi:hypothetical protein